jgi:hypothetical protein
VFIRLVAFLVVIWPFRNAFVLQTGKLANLAKAKIRAKIIYQSCHMSHVTRSQRILGIQPPLKQPDEHTNTSQSTHTLINLKSKGQQPEQHLFDDKHIYRSRYQVRHKKKRSASTHNIMSSAIHLPIELELHGPLALALSATGLSMAAIFVVLQGNPGKSFGPTVRLLLEIILAGASSLALGFASLFLFLWAGVYV